MRTLITSTPKIHNTPRRIFLVGKAKAMLEAAGVSTEGMSVREMRRLMAQRQGMINAAGGEEKVLAATGYTNIDDVPIAVITSMAQRQGMIARAGGGEKILATTGATDIDDVPIDMMRPMAQRQGVIDRAGGKEKVLAAFPEYDNIDDVPIANITSMAERNGRIVAAGGKKDILAAFRCTNINDIQNDVLVLLCAVGGVNHMKDLLGVDSLVGVDIGRLEEQTTFWTNLKDLEAYKDENDGDVCVPTTYAKNQPLANWVMNIRALKQTNSPRLTPRREALLNSIGFVWSVQDAEWEEMFNKLVKHKAKHGVTNVPRSAGTLGLWVKNQRARLGNKRNMPQNNSEKTNQRIQKLDSIGFVW
jgi:hypothetical protein